MHLNHQRYHAPGVPLSPNPIPKITETYFQLEKHHDSIFGVSFWYTGGGSRMNSRGHRGGYLMPRAPPYITIACVSTNE
jgi:hypothetical protein